FDGEVKLIDFGIAKAESRLQKTQAGILKGKFSYMSPEQVKGQPIDGRSDIFAAGILLWELICGEKLFTGDSDFAILEKVRNGIIPAPRTMTRTCPEGLEKVILKALANDPLARYQGASELHDDLMRFTLVGDMVYGHRQLAEWIREEFAQDWEKEQARLRGWIDVGEEKSDVTPSDPRRRLPRMVPKDLAITPMDPFPGPALMNAIEVQSSEPTQQFRIIADKDTLVAPPTPPKGITPVPDSHELPTMKIDEDALVQAEKEFAARQAVETKVVTAPPPVEFELNAEDRTRAVRRLRSSPMMRPVKVDPPKTARKWPFYVGIPLVLAAGAAVFFLSQAEEVRPGKIVVTPSPSVSAELFIDGRPSGPLPPFVHTVAAGSHRIEVRADGYKSFQTRVDVPSGGKPLTIEAPLVSEGPMQVEPVVMTQPKPEPATPVKADPARQKRVATRAAKPESPRPAAVAEKIDPPPIAQSTPAPVPAIPQTTSIAIGYLTAATKPAARLSIDGRDTGRWTPVPPANPIALPAGAHTIVFETADGRRLEEQLQIEAGKTSRLIRSLP
ncbi:MAG: protein kinase, partial [Myxococcales bacterium]